ncbi:unnamed protein product [Bemisia tabaci]|uniref:Insulin-like domain-containing protein n=1 Tax=Bemisia tabaci TaxID=7038 RepID=A0A9P0A9M6_BEMTA|nr:unnamed protein product [Bemisia tabaci]
MRNQKPMLLLIVTSFVTLILIDGRIARGQHQFARDARSGAARYCGKRMAEMLMMVCRGALSKRTLQKLDDEYQSLGDETDARLNLRELDYPGALFGQFYPNEFQIFNKAKALSTINDENFRRRRRGIVEECCYNACSKDDLRLYCAHFK